MRHVIPATRDRRKDCVTLPPVRWKPGTGDRLVRRLCQECRLTQRPRQNSWTCWPWVRSVPRIARRRCCWCRKSSGSHCPWPAPPHHRTRAPPLQPAAEVRLRSPGTTQRESGESATSARRRGRSIICLAPLLNSGAHLGRPFGQRPMLAGYRHQRRLGQAGQHGTHHGRISEGGSAGQSSASTGSLSAAGSGGGRNISARSCR